MKNLQTEQAKTGDHFQLRNTAIRRTGPPFCAVASLGSCSCIFLALLLAVFILPAFPLNAFAADVTLAWDANTETDLAGYKVYYGTASRSYGTPINVGNVTTYTVTNLVPGTYYFTVTAYNTSGQESGYSNEVSTLVGSTDTTPPVISAVTATGITTSGATITWTTNEASDTQVEYGLTTAYGSSTTLNTTMVTDHSAALTGLSLGTTYHYRVKSKDASSNLAVSGDYTFTTGVPPDTTPPTISAVASSGVTGTAATITWTTNELSDTQVEYGTTTAYGSSTTLNASLVTAHSQTLTGLTGSTTYHYRVKSKDAAGNAATSGDYTFTTADTTPPVISAVVSSNVISSGATITWTTNEASDSQVEYGTTTAYGSSTTLNTSKVTAHTQTLSGLTAGTTYHYRVKSKDAAGNLATSADFTFTTAAVADTTPPLIWAVASSGITATGATITWTTDEASDSQVEYGVTTAYGSSTAVNASMVAAHSQALTGLAGGTTYHYRVKSKDASGNVGVSGDYTFSTIDTTAPVISAVSSSGVTATNATITWTTNELSDTQVEYGTTTAYGSSTALNPNLVTAHTQALAGLNGNTTYHYRVKSRDPAGNLALSGDFTFTTSVPPDTTPPAISGVTSSNLNGSGGTSASITISWMTDELSDSQVEYGTTTAYGSSTTIDTNKVTSHSQGLTGLAVNTTYHYRVKSRDAAGNLATSGDYTFLTQISSDTTPPVISAVASSGITSTGATITWTTDEASNSQVEYGTTTSYGYSTTLNSSMVTAHSQALTGLLDSTTYHYRVRSTDAAGNLAFSGDYTLTTSAASDISTGLVAAYAFDEGTGSKTADTSGSANVGTLYGAKWTATAKFGKALMFNGNGYVSAGATGLPALNAAKTISFWIYLTGKVSASMNMLAIANRTQSASVQQGFKSSKVGTLQYGDTWLVAANPPSVRAWHHMGYTFDGVTHCFYIDGVLASTSTVPPQNAVPLSLEVGRWITGTQYFKGNIDEVRIYNRALAQDELRAAMNTPITGSTSGSGGVVTTRVPDPDDGPAELGEGRIAAATSGVPDTFQPIVDIRMSKQAYGLGDTVSAGAYWISNPSLSSRNVELKTWLAAPGLDPIALDKAVADELSALPAGLDQNFGPIPLFEVTPDLPRGAYQLNARLIDPVTGDLLSEASNSFTVASAAGSAQRTAPMRLMDDNTELWLESRIANRESLDYETTAQHRIANWGYRQRAIELKVWLEAPGRDPIPVFSLGSDGSLVLPPGSDLNVDPLVSFQLPQDVLPGSYLLKSRVLDAATGQILKERQNEVVIR